MFAGSLIVCSILNETQAFNNALELQVIISMTEIIMEEPWNNENLHKVETFKNTEQILKGKDQKHKYIEVVHIHSLFSESSRYSHKLMTIWARYELCNR